MRLRAPILAALFMVGSGALVFWFFQRQLSSASLAFGSHPEVVRSLESSLDDLKKLAELDPDNKSVYRRRFDEVVTTTNRLQILEHTHDDLVGRYETLLLTVFALSVVVSTGVYVLRQSRNQARLSRLQYALTRLAEGQTDLEIGDHRRDTIGRISSMVEQTSRVMARDRKRLASLRNLSAWQEAARRHAHEIRTPLTGARLEISRVTDLVEQHRFDGSEEVLRAANGAQKEIDRLTHFTQQFHQFARLPSPSLVRQDLGEVLDDMFETYRAAWPNLTLELEARPRIEAAVDRDLIRQVLVNLCDNSSRALGERVGSVEIRLTVSGAEAWIDVKDTGPGIATAVRERMFEPYTTTKEIGEGVGLGLPISKKIMLDHAGDLELVDTSEAGARFRLSLPRDSPDGVES